MEKWQQRHIRNNLLELVKLTTCNTELILILKTHKLLGDSDTQDLEASSTPLEKSLKLYEILLTRKDAYETLVVALLETKQSGAVYILNTGTYKICSGEHLPHSTVSNATTTSVNYSSSVDIKTIIHTARKEDIFKRLQKARTKLRKDLDLLFPFLPPTGTNVSTNLIFYNTDEIEDSIRVFRNLTIKKVMNIFVKENPGGQKELQNLILSTLKPIEEEFTIKNNENQKRALDNATALTDKLVKEYITGIEEKLARVPNIETCVLNVFHDEELKKVKQKFGHFTLGLPEFHEQWLEKLKKNIEIEYESMQGNRKKLSENLEKACSKMKRELDRHFPFTPPNGMDFSADLVFYDAQILQDQQKKIRGSAEEDFMKDYAEVDAEERKQLQKTLQSKLTQIEEETTNKNNENRKRAEDEANILVETLVKEYKTAMQRKLKKLSSNDESCIMDCLHESELENVELSFTSVTIGVPEFQRKWQEHLEKKIEIEYESMQGNLETRLAKANELINEEEKNYRQPLTEMLTKLQEQQELQEFHQKSVKSIVKDFQNPFSKNSPNFVKVEKQLQEKIDHVYQSIVEDGTLERIIPLVDNHYGGTTQTAVQTDKPTIKNKVLLLQIAFHQIGAASIPTGNEQKEPEQMNFYPAVVALTQNDEWLYGDDACNYSGNRTWDLKECWLQYDWSEEVIVGGQCLSINVAFLLAVLITAIIRELEDEATEKIFEALVTVPYWFTSFHRQQVMNAASISDLVTVQLINENSCSAFLMYSNKSHETSYDTVVISENSLKVDISLYSYERGMLILRGHCGDYEAKEASKESIGVFKYIYGILDYFVSHQDEVGVEAGALKSLEQLWHLALTRAEAQKPGSKRRQRKVLLCCESDQWRDLLWKLATKMSHPDFISVRADTPLYGLASLYHSPTFKICSTILYSITDSSPFQTKFFTPEGGSVRATNKQYNIGTSNFDMKVQKFEIQKQSRMSFRIHQVNSGMSTQVAILCFNELPKNFTSVTIALEHSLNGLLQVHSVEYTQKDHYYRSHTLPLSCNFYACMSFSLSEKEKTALKSIFSQIIWYKQISVNPIVVGLEETLELGEKIKEAINQNKATFVTKSGKENLLEVIDSSLDKLRHQSISQVFVLQQKDLFNGMSATYKIKL